MRVTEPAARSERLDEDALERRRSPGHAGLGRPQAGSLGEAANRLLELAQWPTGPGQAQERHRAPRPGGGMGLNLLNNVASRWGVAYDGGTSVWFELSLPSRALL